MSSPASASISFLQLMQSAFKLIALLQFTAYMWPKQAVVNNGDSFDFIIVGAGTAGSVIANRLTENPNTEVLLIEAGGDPPLESDLPGGLIFLKQSRYDWNYTTEADYATGKCHQSPKFAISLGKMLGGSSSLNYLVYARGYPKDFNSWAEISKDSSWGWENVLPFYIKSERFNVPEILKSNDKVYHGTDGYLGVTMENSTDITNYLDAFKEIGVDTVLDYNPDHPTGYSNYLVTIDNGHRQSSATAYLTPVKDRPNLHVMKDSTVTKIIIKDNTATGVNVLTNKGESLVINARKEVVVSAGTMNSPKLLMLSGIGPKEHLTSKHIEVVADLPVGENMQDHAGVVIIHKLNQIDPPPLPFDPHIFPVSTFRGLVALDRNQNYPDYGVNNYIADDSTTLAFCSYAYRFMPEMCDHIYRSSEGKMIVFNQIINFAPKSRGTVLLRSSDPSDPPEIHVRQFSDPEDINNLVKYIQDLLPVINTTYYRSIGAEFLNPIPSSCKEFEEGTTEYWRCYAQCVSSSVSHYTSTCPMGTVLDGKLKVHGINGLRVADASVMPTITHANPAVTIIMIGEKAADFIKKDYEL